MGVPEIDFFRVRCDLAFSCVDGLFDLDLVLYPGDGWTRVGHGIPKAERTRVELEATSGALTEDSLS